MIVYEKPGCVRVEYRPMENFILLDWTAFTTSMAEIQELHEKTLAAAKQHHCYYYLAETSKVRTVFLREIIRWWGDIWVPKLAAAGLKAIVTVVPTSALAQLSTRSWQAEVTAGITMRNVKSFAEATAIIRELQQAARQT